MRLAAVALLTLLTNASAFTHTPLSQHRSPTSLSALNKEIDLQKLVLSTFTAATLLTSPFAAISNAAPTATAVDPLAKEKSLVLTTKTALESATTAVPTYESQLKEAQALVAKDDAAVKTAEKKVKDIKKNLLSVNDKLAEAKGKGSAKLVDVLGKDSENIKAKLAEAEKALNSAKTAESIAENDAKFKQTKLNDAQKTLDSAKKASADAQSKLETATKKQAELQKKAEAKAKADKAKAEKKAKEDKIKAEKQAKKQKEQAKKQAKKQKEQAKKQAEKAKKEAAKQKELAKKQAEKNKKNKKATSTTPAKKEKKAKKEAVKATAVKSTSTSPKSKVSAPDEKPLVGIKLNDDELKKLAALDDRYAGKKEAPPPAPEAPVKGKGAAKKAAK